MEASLPSEEEEVFENDLQQLQEFFPEHQRDALAIALFENDMTIERAIEAIIRESESETIENKETSKQMAQFGLDFTRSWNSLIEILNLCNVLRDSQSTKSADALDFHVSCDHIWNISSSVILIPQSKNPEISEEVLDPRTPLSIEAAHTQLFTSSLKSYLGPGTQILTIASPDPQKYWPWVSAKILACNATQFDIVYDNEESTLETGTDISEIALPLSTAIFNDLEKSGCEALPVGAEVVAQWCQRVGDEASPSWWSATILSRITNSLAFTVMFEDGTVQQNVRLDQLALRLSLFDMHTWKTSWCGHGDSDQRKHIPHHALEALCNHHWRHHFGKVVAVGDSGALELERIYNAQVRYEADCTCGGGPGGVAVGPPLSWLSLPCCLPPKCRTPHLTLPEHAVKGTAVRATTLLLFRQHIVLISPREVNQQYRTKSEKNALKY